MWWKPRPGRGTRARDRARGRVPSRLSGLHRVASLLCPRTLTASENAPQGGRLWSNRPAGALPSGAWRAGPRPSGEGAASGGLGGTFATASRLRAESATAGRESCLDHLNGSLQNVNNVVFCTSLHKSETKQTLVPGWNSLWIFSPSTSCQNRLFGDPHSLPFTLKKKKKNASQSVLPRITMFCQLYDVMHSVYSCLLIFLLCLNWPSERAI